MSLFDFLTKKGATRFPKRFTDIFFSRLGRVNNYDNFARTYIERGYQDNPIVYAIVDDIATSFSKARWYIRDKKTGKEVIHPVLSRLLEQPNPDKSLVDFHQESVTHRTLQGNSFDVFEASSGGLNDGLPNYLYTLPAEDIQIIPTKDLRGIAGYQVDSSWTEGEMVPASDVLHLRNANPDFDEAGNFLFGQGMFRAARRSIQAYNESLAAGVWLLQNKGAEKLLYNDDENQEWSPESVDALKRKMREQAQGPKNTGNIPIIDGKLGVLDVGSDPKKLLLLEQRDKAALEICNVAKYPPSLLGLKDSTYQNAKEAKKGKWENCIMPLLDERKAGYNWWLAPRFGDNIEICYDINHIDALQEDRLMRGQAISAFAGMITINEARAMANMKPIDGGEEMFAGFTQTANDNNAGSSDKPKDKE